jgi:hypothetical protein
MALLQEACLTLDEMLRAGGAGDVTFALNQVGQDVRRALVALTLLDDAKETSAEDFFVDWG